MAAREAQLEELEALTAIYASNFLPDSHGADAAEDLSATARAEVELPEEGLVLEVRAGVSVAVPCLADMCGQALNHRDGPELHRALLTAV